jgi:hypothetical protein
MRTLAACLLLTAALAARAQLIAVTSPEYRSDVQGKTTIHVSAAAFRSPLTVKSWLPGGAYGEDSTVASVQLDDKGEGSFTFPADRYAHGPIAVRITGTRAADGFTDTCYLQLYNTGGVKWNEGEPKKAPPAAAGMSLVFDDDFKGPLSISGSGVGARYGAHKPDHLDFGDLPFTDPGPNGPFFQRDSYLIIRADANRHTTGLISSINSKDATGFTVMPPYYMECRFIAPYAVGTWPAWWTMTDEFQNGKWGDKTDELDTIEAYGGDGAKSPNAPATYMVTPHMWGYRVGQRMGVYAAYLRLAGEAGCVRVLFGRRKGADVAGLAASGTEPLVFHGEPRLGRGVARGPVTIWKRGGYVRGLHPGLPLEQFACWCRVTSQLFGKCRWTASAGLPARSPQRAIFARWGGGTAVAWTSRSTPNSIPTGELL